MSSDRWGHARRRGHPAGGGRAAARRGRGRPVPLLGLPTSGSGRSWGRPPSL